MPCVVLLVTLVVSGCVTTPSPSERSRLADRLARTVGMSKTTIQANGFILVAYQRISAPGKPLNVYIEGDGLAWKSRRRLSDNPTPTDPLALRLAVLDPADNVVYLARPCQYLQTNERRRCTRAHWSTGRFSEEVIKASDQAIGQMRVLSNATGIHLIGYSGGGAIAALVAARRDDVLSLRTVAGNLDHAAFTVHHGVTPLSASLNPISYGSALAPIPQRHFVGRQDKIIPTAIVSSFIRRLPRPHCASITVVRNVDHQAGWVDNWPRLLAIEVKCPKP